MIIIIFSGIADMCTADLHPGQYIYYDIHDHSSSDSRIDRAPIINLSYMHIIRTSIKKNSCVSHCSSMCNAISIALYNSSPRQKHSRVLQKAIHSTSNIRGADEYQIRGFENKLQFYFAL